MSTHCNRYPQCGCSSVIGTKCHLKDDHPLLLQKDPTFSEEVEQAKRKEEEKYYRKPKRKYPTNYTPPKKRRRK